MDVWERRDNETGAAFNAFVLYRDYGPERSQRKAAELLAKGDPLKFKSAVNRIAVWSAQHEWVSRCIAYDREMDRVAIKARKARIRQIQSTAVSSLSVLAAIGARSAQRIHEEMQLDPTKKVPFEQALKATVAALNEARLDMGDPTEIVGHTDATGGPLTVNHVVSDEDREATLRIMARVWPDAKTG